VLVDVVLVKGDMHHTGSAYASPTKWPHQMAPPQAPAAAHYTSKARPLQPRTGVIPTRGEVSRRLSSFQECVGRTSNGTGRKRMRERMQLSTFAQLASETRPIRRKFAAPNELANQPGRVKV
jgi:hypothetical protein